MISITQINADTIEKIMTAFPTIPFTAQEKLEDIPRPAFKLILDEIKSERFTSGAVRRIYPVRLVYFAADLERPKIECLNLYERLEPVLYEIADKFESGINSDEAVLIVDFEIVETGDLYDPDDEPGENLENLEFMEELN